MISKAVEEGPHILMQFTLLKTKSLMKIRRREAWL